MDNDLHLLKNEDDVELTVAPKIQFTNNLGIDVGSREVFIGGEIEEDFGEWATIVFRHLLRKNEDPITFWINTIGGDVNSMFAFHDLVSTSPAKIITIGIGNVISAGVLMLACGHIRYVTESCVLMSHEGVGVFGGESMKFSELKERFKMEEWSQKHWANLMSRYTPQDASYWRRITQSKAEYWLLGGQAIVDAGLADKIYTKDNASIVK